MDLFRGSIWKNSQLAISPLVASSSIWEYRPSFDGMNLAIRTMVKRMPIAPPITGPLKPKVKKQY